LLWHWKNTNLKVRFKVKGSRQPAAEAVSMKIGELAKRTGLTCSKIRFYEAQGLISQVRRQANGYREYPTQTIRILEIIVTAQGGGFSLREIRHLLPTSNLEKWRKEELLATLRRKVAEIDRLQKRLRQNKARLLEVIRQTQSKPPEVTCAQNVERIMRGLTPIVR
jgi:DNA-binding transcriptional MerR regulator